MLSYLFILQCEYEKCVFTLRLNFAQPLTVKFVVLSAKTANAKGKCVSLKHIATVMRDDHARKKGIASLFILFVYLLIYLFTYLFKLFIYSCLFNFLFFLHIFCFCLFNFLLWVHGSLCSLRSVYLFGVDGCETHDDTTLLDSHHHPLLQFTRLRNHYSTMGMRCSAFRLS
jgi:hypothetical protein